MLSKDRKFSQTLSLSESTIGNLEKAERKGLILGKSHFAEFILSNVLEAMLSENKDQNEVSLNKLTEVYSNQKEADGVSEGIMSTPMKIKLIYETWDSSDKDFIDYLLPKGYKQEEIEEVLLEIKNARKRRS